MRALEFPKAEGDMKCLFAEYAILGGMLKADTGCLEVGTRTDWSHPMSEAIARACSEAFGRYGAETDEGWRCACSSLLAHYAGRSPLSDSAMHHWVFYLMAFYDLQFTQVISDERMAHLENLSQWIQDERAGVQSILRDVAPQQRESAGGAEEK